jgi:hypothetical protein
MENNNLIQLPETYAQFLNHDQLMSEVAETIATIVDIIDMLLRNTSPIYFDPEQDELIDGRTYTTKSFYATDESIET